MVYQIEYDQALDEFVTRKYEYDPNDPDIQISYSFPEVKFIEYAEYNWFGYKRVRFVDVSRKRRFYSEVRAGGERWGCWEWVPAGHPEDDATL
jgi:hypothetical protein